MTLRTRLIGICAGVLTIALIAAAVATWGVVRASIHDRLDDRLGTAASGIARALREGDPGPAAGDGLAFQVYERGVVVSRSGPPDAPPLPTDGRHRAEGADGTDWRVTVRTLPGGRVLSVGILASEADRQVQLIARIEAVITVSVLALAALLAWAAIRRAMRPLENVAETARAIGGGDLGRRIKVADDHSEVGRVAIALNEMLGEIESASAVREAARERQRRFVADASHELRTPVAAIRGYAELFRRGAGSRPEDLALVFERIEAESERMGRLVEDLLSLAALDEEAARGTDEIDLAALARDAVHDAIAIEPDRHIGFEGDALWIRGDAARLHQIPANLLANVRRHTPPGAHATVRVFELEGEAILEVADHGPGIAEDDLDRIFDRFHRAGAEGSGTGLGLAIVSAVARAHGGSARARNAPGGGAVLSVRLPLTGAR